MAVINITGMILAGGKSRRMGTDKLLLELDGVPLISLLADRLLRVADSVLLAPGEQEREELRFLRLPMVCDHYPQAGPLAGLHAGLESSASAWTLVMAADLPFVPEKLLRHLAVLAFADTEGIQAVVPMSVEGKVQPLLGLYHHSVLPSLREALDNRRLRVMEWLDGLKVKFVLHTDMPGSDTEQRIWLLNMNTPSDYHEACRLTSVYKDGVW